MTAPQAPDGDLIALLIRSVVASTPPGSVRHVRCEQAHATSSSGSGQETGHNKDFVRVEGVLGISGPRGLAIVTRIYARFSALGYRVTPEQISSNSKETEFSALLGGCTPSTHP